jgi:hypothetical protein
MKKILVNVVLLISFVPFIHAQTNYALNFDGTNDYVNLPNNSSLQPTGGSFSAEAWIYIEEGAPSDQKVLFTLQWSPSRGYAMNVYQDGASNYYFAASIYLSGDVYWSEDATKFIPTKTWTQIAMTWTQNGNLTAYQNGQMIHQTSTSTSSYSANSSAITLGCGDGSFGFLKGIIDEVRIWNTARTSTEISNNLNKELVGNESGLIAYYKMSNGSGATLSDNQTNVTVNDGTITSATWISSDAPVPVELTSFTANTNGSAITLNWHTATEVNNYGFEIERRVVNGEQSRQEAGGQATVNSWQKIGFVQGAGTSNAPKEYSYSDATASSGSYVYRLKQIDVDGIFKYSQSVEVSFMTPAEFGLDQNYPNPFNPSTVISYQIPLSPFSEKGERGGFVTLKVYNEQKEPGSYTAEFNGARYSSGIYFFKLTTNQFSSVRKMLMIK